MDTNIWAEREPKQLDIWKQDNFPFGLLQPLVHAISSPVHGRPEVLDVQAFVLRRFLLENWLKDSVNPSLNECQRIGLDITRMSIIMGFSNKTNMFDHPNLAFTLTPISK